MSLISETTLETIRETANDEIETILDELGVDINFIQGIDDEIRCPCPVHGGDNPTAFSYSMRFKRWRCYTSNCHEKKDSIFGLVQLILSEKENRTVGFRESVFWLGKLLNIPVDGQHNINEDDMEIRRLNNRSKVKNRIMSKKEQINKNEKFVPIPISSLNGKIKPSEYFLKQGFSEEILKKYHVGHCDDPKKEMYLRSYAPVLNETGDMMIGVSGRIVFEKCDICGDFHDPSSNGCPRDNKFIRSHVKWKHYGFNSSSVLYNSWFAEKYIRESGVVVLLEGPKNVWWLEQHGVHNSVCIFGLNVFDYHISKFIEFGVRTVAVALDNDERGINAAQKLDETIGRYFNLRNINHLLNRDEDISNVTSDRINNVIKPFIKSLEYKCQTN